MNDTTDTRAGGMQEAHAQPANCYTGQAHTPGPWHFVSILNALFVYTQGTDSICRLYRGKGKERANARLIAAAPELLAALLALVDIKEPQVSKQCDGVKMSCCGGSAFHEEDCRYGKVLKQAREAIAKACIS